VTSDQLRFKKIQREMAPALGSGDGGVGCQGGADHGPAVLKDERVVFLQNGLARMRMQVVAVLLRHNKKKGSVSVIKD